MTVMLLGHVITGGVASASMGTAFDATAEQPDALLTRKVNPIFPAGPALYVMI